MIPRWYDRLQDLVWQYHSSLDEPDDLLYNRTIVTYCLQERMRWSDTKKSSPVFSLFGNNPGRKSICLGVGLVLWNASIRANTKPRIEYTERFVLARKLYSLRFSAVLLLDAKLFWRSLHAQRIEIIRMVDESDDK
uniref:Uncharacterized protein n=1 Tax=Arundo donax TaxID=35708 RepID=A0A0A9EL87_ARUDO